jgi:hypothetical protein
MAADFLAVRSEVADQGGNTKEPGEPATTEP